MSEQRHLPVRTDDEPKNPFVAYRWVGSLGVLGLGIALMIQAL